MILQILIDSFGVFGSQFLDFENGLQNRRPVDGVSKQPIPKVVQLHDPAAADANGREVAAAVAGRKIVGIPGHGMERLMDVAQ